jgi:hypothetical protein
MGKSEGTKKVSPQVKTSKKSSEELCDDDLKEVSGGICSASTGAGSGKVTQDPGVVGFQWGVGRVDPVG